MKVQPPPPESRAAVVYPVEFRREMQATVKNSDAIDAKHRKLRVYIERELHTIIDLDCDDRERLERMYLLADNVAKKIAPFAACKAGCGACCNIAVQVPGIEAQAMGEKLGIPVQTPRPMTPADWAGIDRTEVADRWFGKPCPFLEGNQCSVYAARPLACRLHFNMAATPFFCGTNIEPAHSFVPNYNLNDFWTVLSGLFWRTGVADIREWFPRGLAK